METKQTLIESIENGNGRAVKIHLQTFKGKPYIDIRTWIEDDQGEWKSTQKGLCLSTELLPELIQALTKAEEEVNHG
jgi:hypothetical protein